MEGLARARTVAGPVLGILHKQPQPSHARARAPPRSLPAAGPRLLVGARFGSGRVPSDRSNPMKLRETPVFQSLAFVRCSPCVQQRSVEVFSLSRYAPNRGRMLREAQRFLAAFRFTLPVEVRHHRCLQGMLRHDQDTAGSAERVHAWP